MSIHAETVSTGMPAVIVGRWLMDWTGTFTGNIHDVLTILTRLSGKTALPFKMTVKATPSRRVIPRGERGQIATN